MNAHAADQIGADKAMRQSRVVRLIVANSRRCMDEKLRILNELPWGEESHARHCFVCRDEPMQDEWGRDQQKREGK